MAFNDSGMGAVHKQENLTNVMVDYVSPNRIADLIFPRVSVDKESNTYPVWDKANLEYDSGVGFLRAPDADYVRIARTMSEDSYICKEYGAESPVGQRVSEEADFNADRAAMYHLANRLMLDRELRIAAQLFNASNITQTVALSTGDQWDEYSEAGNEPIDDIELGAKTIELATGMVPNTLVLGKEVYTALLRNPQVLALIRGGNGTANTDFLAEVFSVDRVLVGTGVYNSAAPDLDQTMTGAYGWGKMALLAYVAPAPALESPSLGYQFTKEDWTVDMYWEDKTRSNIHRLREISDNKIVSAACGYLITAAVT